MKYQESNKPSMGWRFSWSEKSSLRTVAVSRSPIACAINQHAPIALLGRHRNIHGGIGGKEVHRLEADGHFLTGHDWPILDAGIVGGAKGMPNDNILILDTRVLTFLLSGLDPRRNPLPAQRLHGVGARGEKLVVVIPRDPDGMGGELGAFGVVGRRVREQHLAVEGRELESDGPVGDGVQDGFVDDFERPVDRVVEVEAGFVRDDLGRRRVADSERVVDFGVLERHWVGFFYQQRILVAGDCRVDAQGEDVLVVGCH